MPETVPNFVGAVQVATPLLILALLAAVALLVIENWPEKPKGNR